MVDETRFKYGTTIHDFSPASNGAKCYDFLKLSAVWLVVSAKYENYPKKSSRFYFFRERLFLLLQNQEYLGIIFDKIPTRGFRLEIK